MMPSDKLDIEFEGFFQNLDVAQFDHQTRHDILKSRRLIRKDKHFPPFAVSVLRSIAESKQKKSEPILGYLNFSKFRGKAMEKRRPVIFGVIADLSERIERTDEKNSDGWGEIDIQAFEKTLTDIQERTAAASSLMKLSLSENSASVRLKKGKKGSNPNTSNKSL